VAPYYSVLLVQQLKREIEQEKTFSNSNVKDNLTHLGKNFQTKSIISALEMTFSWITEQDGYMKAWWDHHDMAWRLADTMMGIG
jgi:hypothetical protein